MTRRVPLAGTTAKRPHVPHVSQTLAAVLIDALDGETLRHLAAAREWQDAARRPRLTRDGTEELAAMLVDGRRATIGWWRRHTAPPAVPAPRRWPVSRADLKQARWAARWAIDGGADPPAVAAWLVGIAEQVGSDGPSERRGLAAWWQAA